MRFFHYFFGLLPREFEQCRVLKRGTVLQPEGIYIYLKSNIKQQITDSSKTINY